MEIRRFRGKDIRDGMLKVRSCLGEDAIILSTRSVDDEIEILASTESAVLAVAKADDTPAAISESAPAGESEHREATSPPSASVAAEQEKLVKLETEILELKNMLTKELGRLQQFPRPISSPHDSLVTRLAATGMPQAFALELAASWEPKPTTLGELARRTTDMLVSCDDEWLWQPGIHAFIGASGAGKTTTVAKLAARYALQRKRQDIVLITTDRFKIGGQDKLQGFGDLLQITVASAGDVKDLSRLLRKYSDRSLVLIDTGGMGQSSRDELLFKYLGQATVEGRKIRNHIVVSATGQHGQQDQIVSRFGRDNLESAILTKTDEAVSLGAALTTLTNYQLPLAYQCDGAGLSDLGLPNIEDIVQAFLASFQSDQSADPYKVAGMS